MGQGPTVIVVGVVPQPAVPEKGPLPEIAAPSSAMWWVHSFAWLLESVLGQGWLHDILFIPWFLLRACEACRAPTGRAEDSLFSLICSLLC